MTIVRASARLFDADVVGDWLRRVSRGDWFVAQSLDPTLRLRRTLICRRCQVEVPFVEGERFDGCACDAVATGERAWREHFGLLAEAFG